MVDLGAHPVNHFDETLVTALLLFNRGVAVDIQRIDSNDEAKDEKVSIHIDRSRYGVFLKVISDPQVKIVHAALNLNYELDREKKKALALVERISEYEWPEGTQQRLLVGMMAHAGNEVAGVIKSLSEQKREDDAISFKLELYRQIELLKVHMNDYFDKASAFNPVRPGGKSIQQESHFTAADFTSVIEAILDRYIDEENKAVPSYEI